MTTSGWLVMLFSVGAVTCLLAVCLYLVFRRADRADRLHGWSRKLRMWMRLESTPLG